MKVTAVSAPNIALIKYWGNRNNELRLPAADSLSITLDSPHTTVEVEPSDTFTMRSFDETGKEKVQTATSIARLKNHFDLTQAYLESTNRLDECTEHVSVVIRSQIPPSIGIASSAAVFSCLAEAYAGLLAEQPLTREQISIIARLGSGSAARSVMGGFVALKNTGGDEIGSASTMQIAPADHWALHDIILVPDQKEKKVGSTEGHAMAATSPLFAERIKHIPRRMQECIDAILTKNFEKLQRVAEEDTLDMHRVMQTQNPPLNYLSDETHRIIGEIESLRKNEHLEVLYTMDAGPTVHLICTEDARGKVEQFAQAQKGCVVLKTKIGEGSKLL